MQPQEAMPPEYGAPHPAALRPEDHIRLDKTRVTFVKNSDGSIAIDPKGNHIRTGAYSTVEASERTPDDPHFNVRYMQDGLPFDANGNLVPDDGKTGPYQGMGPDGKMQTYRYLYDATTRKIVEKKMRRIVDGIRSKAPAEDDLEDDISAREIESDLVNVPEWAAGRASYLFHLVHAAVKKRWNVSLKDTAEIIRFLVLDDTGPHFAKEDIAAHFQRFLVTNI